MLQNILQIMADGWGIAILKGAAMTLFIAVAGMLLGCLFGLLGAMGKRSGIGLISGTVTCYTTLIRSVPELLVIYLLFFSTIQGGSQLAEVFGYADEFASIYPMLIGILAISVISGSYSVEVFRGALAAIAPGQLEAAHAMGMSRWVTLRRIVLPQMIWHALPGASNVWQTTLKDTALISAVGLVELMRVATIGSAKTREPLIFYIFAAIAYFVIASISQILLSFVERAFSKGLKGR